MSELCEIISKFDLKKSYLTTWHEVFQHYLEVNSYLQEVLQHKNKDQLLETTVNICITIEAQGV